MGPAVVAAIIAGSVSLFTLIVSVATQTYAIRRTSRDTGRALEAQSIELERSLTQQSEQLDRILAEQRARTLNERFATAADRLGSDKPSEVRLAGVYAMAGLADDWPENRQTCVDVLCAYLRMPHQPDPGGEAPAPDRLAYRASREVRHTVIRVITAHLKDDVAVSWQGLNFDFTGVIFDGGTFAGANFSGAEVDFEGAEFCGGTVNFELVRFSGGTVDFTGAKFTGGTVDFDGAKFTGGWIDFAGARFCGGTVGFGFAEFCGGAVDFADVVDWSQPPGFYWDGAPPAGVVLPTARTGDPR
jgi:Pentapeptide repeats (9 copies)